MVKLIQRTNELLEFRKNEIGDVGFVPTMGNLHAGHISLLEEALKDFNVIYFSIFVNPKQFGPTEDFNRYPRTLEADLKLIEELLIKHPSKKVIVYSPLSPTEVFSGSQDKTLSVEFLSTMLEGNLRPGHFDGVCTVVYRLFELIRPARAYFGLKDYQQCLVIKKMTSDLMMGIDIKLMPIMRESTGLALSSRNQYLSDSDKDEALVIIKTLKQIEKIIQNKKENISKAKSYIAEILKNPKWNYLELRDAINLSDQLENSKELTLLAVYQIGSTRLLDNLQMELH